LFDENQSRDAGFVRRVVEAGLRSRPSAELTYPHATLFLPEAPADEINRLRRRWDPAMAAQIAPHITVAYPGEAASLSELVERTRLAAASSPSFVLRTGALVNDGDPADGVFFEIDDIDGGWQALRQLIVGHHANAVPTHVTVVHPRTSGLGGLAWSQLAYRTFDAVTFRIESVAVTAFDGQRWPTVASFRLS
jgi:hypothetical protein